MAPPLTDANRLSMRAPAVAAQWNYERNGDAPTQYSFGSNVKKWWRCADGHEWEAAIGNRTAGKGCPTCAGNIVSDANSLVLLHPAIAAEWDHAKNAAPPSAYSRGSGVAVYWICASGHSWSCRIISRTSKGVACPRCFKDVTTDANRFSLCRPHLLQEWDYEKNTVSPDQVAVMSSIKAHWTCILGHQWIASVQSRSNGHGCKACRLLPTDTNRFSILFPEIADEWHPTLNTMTAADVSYASNKVVWWRCAKGHDWQAVVGTRTGVNKTGCPTCAHYLGQTGTSMIETRVCAELSWIFGNGTIEETVTPRIVIPENYRDEATKIDARFGTRFGGRGLCPDITLRGVFSNFPDHLLVVEWDGAYVHSGDAKRTLDIAKTHMLRMLQIFTVRLREAPLALATPYCVSVGATSHASPPAIKRAVDTLLHWFRPRVIAAFTPHIQAKRAEYLARATCQNQAVADAYIAARKAAGA